MLQLHTQNSQSINSEIPDQKISHKGKQPVKMALIAAAHAVNDTYSGFISPLLPFLIENLSLLKVEASLFSFFYQGVNVFQPLIGHWADSKDLRKIALFAPAVTGIFLSLFGAATNYYSALLFCFLAGIAAATMHAILPGQMSIYAGKDIGKGMSLWVLGGDLGVMFGPIIITAVLATSSRANTPWLMIGGIIITIFLSIFLNDDSYIPSNNKEGSPIPTKKLLKIMVPLAIIVTLRSIMTNSVSTYLPVYLRENGAGIWLSGAAMSIIRGFGVLGIVLGGIAKDRHGFRIVLIISVVFSGLSVLAFLHTTSWMQLLTLTVLGTANMMMYPTLMATVQKNFPENRSLANGVYMALLFPINAVAGIFTGFLYDQIGGFQTFLIGALISLTALPFLFLLPEYKTTEHQIFTENI